jgi:PAS domain S-box-containing protein
MVASSTERKKVEEAVHGQRDLLRNTLNSITDAVFILDSTDPPDAPKILECNQAASTIFGYGRPEMLGKTMGFLHESEEALQEFQSLLYSSIQESRLPFHLNEFHMKRKGGSIFPSEHSVSQLLNDKGERTGWVTVVRDITERKQAEEKVRHLSSFPQLTPACIVEFDSAGRVVYCNPAAASRLGELGVGNDPRLYLPNDADEILKMLQRKRDMRFSREVRIKDAIFSEIIYTTQEFGTARIYASDITERKRAEEALANERNILRTLIDNLPDNIFIKDGESRFVVSNVAHARLLRAKTPDEIVGKTDYDIFPPELAASYYADEQAVIRSGQPLLNREERTIDPEGKTRWLLTTKVPLRDDHGKVIGIAGMNRDITERKRAEEALRESFSLLRATLESTADGILVVDRDGKVSTFNLRFAEMWRIPQSLLEADDSLKLQQFVSDQLENPEHFLEKTQELYSEPDRESFDVLRFKDGRVFERYSQPERVGDRIVGRVWSFRDVTEHKRMEEALRDSEEKFRSLVEDTAAPVGVTDMTGCFTYVNRALADLMGYSTRELSGQPLVDYLHAEDRDRVLGLFLQVLSSSEKAQDIEFRAVRRDGSVRHLWTRPTRLKTQGETIGLLSIITDITERKHMEEELRRYSLNLEQLILKRTRKLSESEERFRELADLLPEIVFEVDRSDNFTFLNRVTFNSTGYSKEDFEAGLNELRLFSPQDRERRKDAVSRMMSGEMLGGDEYLLQKRGGSTFPAIVHSAPIVREKRIVGLRGIAIDITERKQMEEELRSARERLERVITGNPAVIFTGRPRPDLSDLDTTYMSRSVVSLLGFRPQDLIGHPEMWQARVHPDDLRRYYAELPLLWKEGEHTFEYRFLHKDGNYLWIREEAKVIRDAAGKPAEVMGYWTDVSKEKQMDEIRDRFISAVTHELRTPLVSIGGYLDLVLSGESGPVSSEVKSNLEVVKRNSDRLTSLTDELLDIQRLQSGRLQVNLQTIDFREIIRHATSEIKPFIKAKKQNFNVVVPKRPLMALVDPTRMSQVLMNLLSNASKFTPEGGRIRLTVRDDRHIIVVKVADTGIGLRREDLTRAFEPFAAIKKPTHIKGTGLGLSVTKGLVEAHMGRIWAESPGEGNGATFTFALPKRGVK